jgi:hypothetical protein
MDTHVHFREPGLTEREDAYDCSRRIIWSGTVHRDLFGEYPYAGKPFKLLLAQCRQ